MALSPHQAMQAALKDVGNENRTLRRELTRLREAMEQTLRHLHRVYMPSANTEMAISQLQGALAQRPAIEEQDA